MPRSTCDYNNQTENTKRMFFECRNCYVIAIDYLQAFLHMLEGMFSDVAANTI